MREPGRSRVDRNAASGDLRASYRLAQMNQMIGGYRLTQMIYVAAKLKLAEALESGPQDAPGLAEACGADPRSLNRLLRSLVSLGILVEKDAEFRLTPLGELLHGQHPDSLRDHALTYGENWWWNPWGELLYSVQTGQPAFKRVFGQELFDYLNQEPAAAEIFQANMSATTKMDAKAILAAYDFSTADLVIDLGGGNGELLAKILEVHSSIQGLLFDLEPQIERASRFLAEQGLHGRCKCVAGSFFDEIPPDGDIYMLKSVLHDWEDERASLLLNNCREVMSKETRLLIIEHILGFGDNQAAGSLLDMSMLVLTTGRERTLREYELILGRAGLQIARAISTAYGPSILEITIN